MCNILCFSHALRLAISCILLPQAPQEFCALAFDVKFQHADEHKSAFDPNQSWKVILSLFLFLILLMLAGVSIAVIKHPGQLIHTVHVRHSCDSNLAGVCWQVCLLLSWAAS